MSDVACVCCAPVVAEVRARGLDPEELVAGLPVPLSQIESPLRRVAWEPFREFARRSAAMLGGPSELEEVAARSAHRAVPGAVRRLLPRLRSARPIYAIGARWWGPWVFRGTRARCEELADGRLREVIEILPGYGECPELFEGLRGVLRAMPRLLGQPDAVVELTQDGRRAEFLIATPPPRNGTRRGGRWRGIELAPGPISPLVPDDLEELGFAQEQLRDAVQRARVAASLLADRTRRLDTVRQLGHELVWHRDAHRRVEGMVHLLHERLPLRGLRIWCGGDEEEGLARVAEWGATAGPPSAERPLEVSGRGVGRLDLWTRPSEEPAAAADPEAALLPEDDALLGELVPWIALALDTASADHRIAELRQLLDEDLAQWQRAEMRLQQALRNGSGDRSAGGVWAVDLPERLRRWAPRLHRAAGRHAELELVASDDVEPVFLDAERLERILVELVTELRDAGCHRLRIQLHAPDESAAPRRAAEGAPQGSRRSALLELRGEGAEVAPKRRTRLLEVLAALAGAPPSGPRIEVEASLEGEPRVRLRLPLEPPQARVPNGLRAELASDTELRDRLHAAERILLVESDPERRGAARARLERRGYRVVEAASAAEALDRCQREGEPIDLLMTDWSDPSLDLETARRALDHRSELRGVLLMRLPRRR